jgi:hypothetical protein
LELERAVWIHLLSEQCDHNRSDGWKRFIVRADGKLTAFLGLESAIRAADGSKDCGAREINLDRLSRIK